jgi:hypothetical protein
MRRDQLERAACLLALMVFVTPMLMFGIGHGKKKPVKEVVADQQQESPEVSSIISQVITSENLQSAKLRAFSPRIETYVQYYQSDKELGDVATNDAIFLGRLKFAGEAREVSFVPTATPDWFLRHVPDPSKVVGSRPHLHLAALALEALTVDGHHFDRKHYAFEPVRWEYLGDIRCLAIDVHPRQNEETGAFQGRIWVEAHNFAIVRMNGTRIRPAKGSFYVHFDCWRENLEPGQWLPVYIYSQETDLGKALRYKSETRLWGYDLDAHHTQQEWTAIQVDAPAPIRDSSEQSTELSPVQSARHLNMEAEQNVLDRLEAARLIAPAGSVDKVLATVVNNLRVTNHLDGMPPVQCRVMMTSTLESFSLAYTIILSRGLIDVLPDEASLAMVLAHELAHIALGHKLDPKFAFNDRLIVSDEDLLSALDFTRPRADEVAADSKGIEFLKSSPYKDNLGQAGLFLRAATEAAPHVPHLFGAHMGNGLLEGNNKLIRMSALTSAAPELKPRSVDQISALPLGSRLQVNAWDGSVAFTDRKAVALVDAGEKMPFRVTPVIPFLKTYAARSKTAESAKN